MAENVLNNQKYYEDMKTHGSRRTYDGITLVTRISVLQNPVLAKGSQISSFGTKRYQMARMLGRHQLGGNIIGAWPNKRRAGISRKLIAFR
jgi:hypothetical protein